MKIAKIKIHYSLIFLLILSLFTGSFLNILGIIVCIFLHELGHISMLIKYKVKIKYLELSIIGGIIEIEKKELMLYQKLMIDGIGIIINLIIIILISIINLETLNYLIAYNLFMIVFNLIPIIPLDGYRLLNDVLTSIYDEEYSCYLIKKIDIICLMMLLIVMFILKLYGLLLIWCFLLYKYFRYKVDDVQINKIYKLFKK